MSSHLSFLRPVFISVIFAILSVFILFSVGVIYQAVTGNKSFDILSSFRTQKSVQTCSTRASLALSGTKNVQLEKLAVYQKACHSLATTTMMTFVGIPLSNQNAATEATQTATTLKAFAKYRVRPLVVAEPTDYTTDVNVDMSQFAAGSYTGYLNTMFTDMKDQGVTASEMGIWNPFPEANLPYWKNNAVQYFAPDVNTYVSTLESYFPATQTSIMLNAATYAPNDFNWQNGDYESLLPYVKGITPHSITYAGLEGFPWEPPKGGSDSILNAAKFLTPSIVSQMANYLGTKNIWLNTGTYSKEYATNPSEVTYASAPQRQAILATIDQQALILQKQGYHVSVNIFAQNKSETSEDIDWAYWSGNTPSNSLATPVLTGFISELNQQHVGFWLFDQ